MDLNQILKEEYEKNIAELMDPNALLRLIYDVMEYKPVIKEEVTPPEGVSFDPQEMLLKMIPDIAVSEIGWSDVRTVETKGGATEEISGPQRALLENYLINIGGDSFEERIAAIDRFYTDGATLIAEETSDRTETLVKAISYLVFYKTLTKVVTNFNAASAGFSFESFLATLVNGKQIRANTGTIADYEDRSSGEAIPVSLKLYKEGSLSTEGSYTDLVNDLVKPKYSHPLGNAMRYVVCTKDLSGEELEQEGQINVYQFDFTLANVCDILVQTKDSSAKCVMIPGAVASALEGGQLSGIDVSKTLPGQQNLPGPQELEKIFVKGLEDALATRKITLSHMQLQRVLTDLDWAKRDEIFKDADPKYFGGVEKGVVRGVSALDGNIVKGIMSNIDWFEDLKDDNGRVARGNFGHALGAANTAVRATLAKTKLRDERATEIKRMVGEGEFLSPEESTRLYKMWGLEQRKIALINSWGYLTAGNFHLSNSQSLDPGPPTNTVKLGSIKVGTKYVVQALENVRELLNKEVFEIFQSLKMMSDSLNAFFAGGLKNDGLASTAVDNAQNIQSKEILRPDE